jgi:hypothetical protein
MTHRPLLVTLTCFTLTGCAPTFWTVTDCALTSAVDLTFGGSTSSAGFTGCQANWEPETDTVTLQLMKGGTSGSFALPGPGWLTLRYAGASPQDTTFAIQGWTVAEPIPLTDVQAQYQFDPASGGFGGAFANGSMTVSTNLYSARDEGVHLAATALDADLGNGVRLTGSFVAIAGSFLQAATGTSGGGGSCADDGASCVAEAQPYQDACDAGGGQTPCACGVITLSNCFIRNGCYAEAGAPTSLTAAEIRGSCESAQLTLQDVGNAGACGGCQ